MNHIIKDWIIPPKILSLLKRSDVNIHRNLHKLSLTSKYSSLLSRNQILINKYRGKRCFVIGNGPCLNTHDLTQIKENDASIVMNWFTHHPLAKSLQPTIFCMAEPLANLSNPKTVLSKMLSDIEATAYFFRTEYKDFFHDLPIDMAKVFYMHVKGDYSSYNSIDFTNIVPNSPNTSVMAVMLAIWLGCSPIYLVGFNYDWLAESLHTHFYQENDVVDLSEFLPSYLQRIRHADPHWAAHEKLHQVALKNGQQIFNSDKESFLDAYPYSKSITKIESLN